MLNGLRAAEDTDPRFGEADLTNCEREQIHLAGSIQPHGVLLVAREPDLVIVQASANARDFLQLPGEILGLPLASLGGNLAERVRTRLQDSSDKIPVAVRCQVATLGMELDGSIHRPPQGGLIIELEIAGPPLNLGTFVHQALKSLSTAPSLTTLTTETARIFQRITGYDRVMVYQFDEEGHGSVIAEERRRDQESYLGNRYPASDIPQIARLLYERNRIRVLGDVDYEPVPLIAAAPTGAAEPLDLSLCGLRSMSPIHRQYLKNMGVRAALSTSLMVKGKLWGLVICHHDSPRLIPYPVRVVCALLAEAIATRITALEGFVQAQAQMAVRRLEELMVTAIATTGAWEKALFDHPRELLEPLDAGGVALMRDDAALTAGEVPTLGHLCDIQAWLSELPEAPAYATSALASEDPRFDALGAGTAGMLAVPISANPGEYLIWFRPERVRTLTWAGNPYEAVKTGADPSQLSPRASFARWYEVVKGKSTPWTLHDFSLAIQIGNSIMDVMQQIRSIRLLITQQQVKQFVAGLRLSEQPLVIADPAENIILLNKAFERLLPLDQGGERFGDLLRRFQDPFEAQPWMVQVLTQQRPWRGEVRLRTLDGLERNLLLRLDPVVSATTGMMGYVMICNDLSEHKAAELAQRRFEESLDAQCKLLARSVGHQADGLFHDLLSSILGNAQLAALENRSLLEVNQVPRILDNLYASLERTTELLEHLIWYEESGSQRNAPSSNH